MTAPRKLLMFGAIVLPLAIVPTVVQKPKLTWQLYGASVLSTSAPGTVIQDAVQKVHDTLGGYTQQPDGSMSDPSYRVHSEYWNGKSGRERIGRSLTRFNDRTGQEIAIQKIAKDGSETLIFIEYPSAGGSLAVLNALTHALEQRGVKREE